ncbi:GntR family transcriptional regulator [Aminithiophilus ramosus]|uniref:GntR family transcriptional regulator n=2 Tax=Synergistales TaxID=649776 RepID=A0A9Q7EYQ2_9BACT|nr:GntR family transcriptional regulator [Aminithiophilus ramosus]QTX32261.1 GntR family transcriptional regulator [Aminithiophilus ramosus]QVL36129.1 GntR family transcriptional regulator [Synergistota bacterium]
MAEKRGGVAVALDVSFNFKALREQVYDFLKEEMAAGRLCPGQMINIREMSARLGISRTPLRDALFELQGEGFVLFHPRRGVEVRGLTADEIAHAYQVLGALESSVILQDFGRIGGNCMARLEAVNAETAMVLREGLYERYWELNRRFHETLLSVSENDLLLGLADRLRKRLYDFPARRRFTPRWASRSLEEHRELVAFLARGDRQGAALYMAEVHWNYERQKTLVEEFYFASPEEKEASRQERGA